LTRRIGVTLVIAISLLQFGQISVIGTTEYARLTVMTLLFARQSVGERFNASEKCKFRSGQALGQVAVPTVTFRPLRY
jgi:hypothetical protein